jgi:hypothetical protein
VSDGEGAAPAGAEDREVGESRWPMALAVIATGVLHALLPEQIVVKPPYAYNVGIGILLVALVVGDPGRIDRQRAWLRLLTDVLIGLITLTNVVIGIRIVAGILGGSSFWNNATELLVAGGISWLTNVIAFALWYWHLDAGGAAARASGTGPAPAFIFPEMNYPQHVDDGWYPTFPDYLAFSFNTATAFSPTDVSAVRVWAKLLMMAEALFSLGLAALVIARAVNILA